MLLTRIYAIIPSNFAVALRRHFPEGSQRTGSAKCSPSVAAFLPPGKLDSAAIACHWYVLAAGGPY